MTTPANFNTADRIIRMAMKDAGLLQEGDDPSSEAIADNINRLNDLINLWQTTGLKVWLQYDLPIPLVAGQALYTIMPGGDINLTKPTRVIDNGYYIDSNGVRRPLILMSRLEFTNLANPNQQGSLNSYWPNKLKDRIEVTFWLVPDAQAATGVAHVCIQQQVSNLVSVTDTMDFPPEWFLALRWGLADEICGGQPAAIMERCAAKAMIYRNALDDWDVEDASTSFAPDQRSAYAAGNFR
jgi:hypothetical protein